jgi:hypothetical protein
MLEHRIKLQPVGILMRVMYKEVNIGVWDAASVGMLRWCVGSRVKFTKTTHDLQFDVITA